MPQCVDARLTVVHAFLLEFIAIKSERVGAGVTLIGSGHLVHGAIAAMEFAQNGGVSERHALRIADRRRAAILPDEICNV
jgi:hypothetical protein